MIGIGVIGWRVRSRHGLEGFARNYPGAAIRALAQDPKASPVLLEGHGGPDELRAHAGPLSCADYREILRRSDVQLISLMCEPARAPDLVEEVATAGKHILSDKPMAGRVADAERIVASVRRHGVQMLVGFNTRYDPPLRRTYDVVRSGEIGDLRTVNLAYCFGGKPAGFTATPEFARNFGGGDLTIAGCYAVDLVRWLAGREAKRVFARIGTFFFEDYRGVMEDLGNVRLTFEGGLSATILSGRLPAPGRCMDLDAAGARGSVRVSADADTFTIQGKTSPARSAGPPPAERMVHEFLRCLEEGRPSPIPPEDGLACVRILQAAYESGRTGKEIHLP
jgi:predicted dehydrogenase